MKVHLRDDESDSSCVQIWCYNGMNAQWVATVKRGVAKVILAALEKAEL